MLYSEDKMEEKAILDVASLMCAAARTAPKARGIDNIFTLVLTGKEKDMLAEKMEEISVRESKGTSTFPRDAKNVKNAQAVVLIGAKTSYLGLQFCDYCGYDSCEKCEEAGARCAFNFIDLGIAIGSAVSVAADHRIDSRVMFSIGKAAMEMDYTEEYVIWLGIPINTTAKSIFFDRK